MPCPLLRVTGASRITAKGACSDASPITSWADAAIPSAIARTVIWIRLPKRSTLPLVSSTDSIPAQPIAKPVVPSLNGLTRLSTITTPTLFPDFLRIDRPIFLADRSALRGQRTTAPSGEFFRSIPAFATASPFFTVRSAPFTPPTTRSASSRTARANAGVKEYFRARLLALGPGFMLSRYLILFSAIPTILLETATTSLALNRTWFFAKALKNRSGIESPRLARLDLSGETITFDSGPSNLGDDLRYLTIANYLANLLDIIVGRPIFN